MTWKIPVKAAIAVGKNSLSPVDDDDECRRANASAAATTSGLGKDFKPKLDWQKKNSSNQLETALGSQESAQNGSKWIKTAPNWKLFPWWKQKLKFKEFF